MFRTSSRRHAASVLLAWVCSLNIVAAHLAAFTDGMYCPDTKYKGPLTNFTDGNHNVFDPLFNLSKDSWFLSKGRLCWQAAPTGVWKIHANTKIGIPWATWPDSTGYYADGKEQSERPTPFDANNPEVQKAGLVSSSGGINSPNMHCANKSTAAGTALAIAYKKSIWEVSMADFAVFSIAPETPFERLAYYTVPDLAACDECICATSWVPSGYGQQNMYMAAHKCKIINTNGGKRPSTPAKVPGPGVTGAKQMIAAFQADGNNVDYTAGVSKVPVYGPSMGYLSGSQTDIFPKTASLAGRPSLSGSPVDITSGSGGTYPRSNRLSDGSLIATYATQSKGNRQIALAQSTDNGGSWHLTGTAATRPGASSDLDNPYVLQLPSGRLLVAYRNHDKNFSTGAYIVYRITISYSDDNGATWSYLSDPASDPAGPNGNWEPFLRNALDGSLQLYYSRENLQADQDILMRTSSDGGRTWTPARAVSGTSIQSRDGMVSVATVSGSSLVAVFESTRDGHFGIYSTTSSDDGETWGNRQQVYTPTGNGNNAGAPQVINAGGTLVVSFMTDEDTQLGKWTSGAGSKLITSTDGGMTWGNKIQVFAPQANWPGMVALSGSELLYMCDSNGAKSQKVTLV